MSEKGDMNIYYRIYFTVDYYDVCLECLENELSILIDIYVQIWVIITQGAYIITLSIYAAGKNVKITKQVQIMYFIVSERMKRNHTN